MKSLNMGFIPDNWSGNTDGEFRIDIGDSEFSNTVEINFTVEDDNFEFDDLIIDYDKAVNANYAELNKLVEKIKINNNWNLLTAKSLSIAFKTIQGNYTPKNNDKIIKFIGTDGPEIIDALDYKTCFYMHCYDEDEESDFTVIFK